MSNKVRLKRIKTPSVIHYAVGKRFPLEGYLNLSNGAIAKFNDYSIDIVLLINNLAKDEISELRDGPIVLSLFKNQNVPFVIVHNKHFSFDLSLNIGLVSINRKNVWFDSDSCSVNIFTVDAKNGILQSIRRVGLQFMEEIRAILKKQTRMSAIDVDSIISENMLRLSTLQMLNLSLVSQTFPSFFPNEGEQGFDIIMI